MRRALEDELEQPEDQDEDQDQAQPIQDSPNVDDQEEAKMAQLNERLASNEKKRRRVDEMIEGFSKSRKASLTPHGPSWEPRRRSQEDDDFWTIHAGALDRAMAVVDDWEDNERAFFRHGRGRDYAEEPHMVFLRDREQDIRDIHRRAIRRESLDMTTRRLQYLNPARHQIQRWFDDDRFYGGLDEQDPDDVIPDSVRGLDEADHVIHREYLRDQIRDSQRLRISGTLAEEAADRSNTVLGDHLMHLERLETLRSSQGISTMGIRRRRREEEDDDKEGEERE